ncbi:MAG: DEAD/DEAH box helicase [Treponema sp.]|nr:DEAD/DEAH box helicase [Treponema sp.]
MGKLPETFHPIIRTWFAETFEKPTPVQIQAWPLIERGENVLALAPTGSGKTLTAFLSAISSFCRNEYPAEKLSVIYVSPLKALNEDIKRNLLLPLAAIKTQFEKEGLAFPPVRVETRSGDTPQSARRKFFIKPPSILVLTPESLAIILLNPKGRIVLSNVKCLIIDEVHAIIGNKRGAYLSCQIERLKLIAGDFQRISLSATVRNPQVTAEFVGKNVHIVSPPAQKKIEFSVEFPDITSLEQTEDTDTYIFNNNANFASRYTPLINYVLKRIWEGATLLVFAESRKRAERLCHLINQEGAIFFAHNGNPTGRDLKGAIAFPHHGSLAKELRRSVEKGLAQGILPCVVATASLELGIDIGDIDEVILAGSPGNVSQVLQRIGRAGHSVGQTSKGKLFAFHGKDLLIAAAIKNAVEERDIEEIFPIENPQDILAQLVLALCSEKDRNIEELYELIKTFYIFKNLNYDSYKRVIRMLAGLSSKENLNSKSRLRDVKQRLWLENTEGTIGIMDGTTTLLYTSSGVITNRGHYSIRLPDRTKIGELDEEFVWERRVGDHFDFGARGWRIDSISDESVEVTPLEKRSDYIPFWKADIQFRSVNLTKKLLLILEEFNKSASIPSDLPACAYNSLNNFLKQQGISQRGLPLSDNKNIIIEIIKGNEQNRDFCSVVVHSFRGGQINYPLSLALSTELEETIKLRVASFSTDDNILFLLPNLGIEETGHHIEEIFRKALLSLENCDTGGITRAQRFFRNRLESSGIFGAAFREAAERSLLLPKAPFGKRTPLWLMRQRSKRLFDAVMEEDGFPVTTEAWRSCLIDTFDMTGFNDLISSINNGEITLSFFQTNTPSPFSNDVVRAETDNFVYEYDDRKDLIGSKSATLSDKIIEEAINNASLRPVLKKLIIEDFVSRLRREKYGYAPDNERSLVEWVKERIAIPLNEWESLCSFIPQEIINTIDTQKIKTIKRNGAKIASIVHSEWEETWEKEPLSILGQWLRYEGPISAEQISKIFGTAISETEDAINALAEVDEVFNDIICEDAESETTQTPLICDRENLELLLRLSRKKARAEIKERAASLIVPFLALKHGLGGNDDSIFKNNLQAWSATAKLWETEIFYARNSMYDPEKLNKQIREGNLVWYGTGGKEKISFCHPEDLELAFENQKNTETNNMMEKLITSAFFNRPRDFWEIKNELNTDSRTCTESLWDEVWKGNLTADSYDPVRRGIEHGFIPKEIEIPQISNNNYSFGRKPKIPSALKNRWKGGAPVHGNWFSLLTNDYYTNSSLSDIDPIEEDALNRDRVRLLLSRWGILCRPFLEYESSVLSWSKLLPTMRRMELAGELVTGRFFAGVNSLQFASPSIASELEKAESFNEFFWMNAADPASPAGLEIDFSNIKYKLCARSSGNRLYYKGSNLLAMSAKTGKELQILIKTDDHDIPRLIEMLKIPRTRMIMPQNKIVLEKINGQDAAKSEYAKYFTNYGFVNDREKLICW